MSQPFLFEFNDGHARVSLAVNTLTEGGYALILPEKAPQRRTKRAGSLSVNNSYGSNACKASVVNILIHEQQHIKQGDIGYAYFIMTLQTVYWFNPLLTRLLKHQRQQIELITDYNVLNCTEQDTAYTTAMVDVLAHNTTDVTGHPMLCMTDSVKNT